MTAPDDIARLRDLAVRCTPLRVQHATNEPWQGDYLIDAQGGFAVEADVATLANAVSGLLEENERLRAALALCHAVAANATSRKGATAKQLWRELRSVAVDAARGLGDAGRAHAALAGGSR